ncbi:putative protein-synthesizing GTPase [Medicago truncatula]|uniref:Uncharacterized protein n=1 Tax=Medicago truncatula TaxID=3880 RepID=A0A396I7S1_MEDTR|nr:putative protein-synthesizing GTPase [Medicago truncatula]
MIPRWKTCPNAPICKAVMQQDRYVRAEFEIRVIEVIEGYGTTTDVVLVNGVLHEGGQIGPIVTTIRALLTPHPMKELCVKEAI